MNTEPTVCSTCNATFDAIVFEFGGVKRSFSRCPTCAAKEKAEADELRAADERRERERVWAEVCPRLYRRTDIDHSGINAAARKAVTEWNISSSHGIGLLGPTGLGKTRAAFHALRRAHEAGFSVAAISHIGFSRLVIRAYSGGEDQSRASWEAMSSLRRADVILFDDLGKAPATERVDSELGGLIEDRTADELPIIWTANGGAEWLIQRFGDDRGEPLVRRLTDYSLRVIM